MEKFQQMLMDGKNEIEVSHLHNKEEFSPQQICNYADITLSMCFKMGAPSSIKQNFFNNLIQSTMNLNVIRNNETTQHKNNMLPAVTTLQILIEGRFLTIKEVAGMNGYSPERIRALALKGILKSYIVGNRRLITVKDAVQFGSKIKRIASRKKSPLVNMKGRLKSKRA